MHDFTDEHLGTRFLGDLYQDVSEQARTDYALFQTPEFIEEFILDRTLDPAIHEYGLGEVRLIDPACGSGHFLLGAFSRLLRRWRQQEPGTNVRVLVERVLGQVHGVDINPYAAAIARFRLVVAALAACGVTRLVDAPSWKIRVAIGDSLRFGALYGQGALEGITEGALSGTAGEGEFVYEYEDAAELEDILGSRYHAVVANPPYITPSDSASTSVYRVLWQTAYREFPLSVPFVERIFDLAVRGAFTGQITSNSFLQSKFGTKLVEFLRFKDVSMLIDASKVRIPGHGTPTVLLFGRNRAPVTAEHRLVEGVSGDSTVLSDSAKGRAWGSVAAYWDSPGYRDQYVTVSNIERAELWRFPVTLGAGDRRELLSRITKAGTAELAEFVVRAGFYGDSHADEVFFLSTGRAKRLRLPDDLIKSALRGADIRDWSARSSEVAIVPYDQEGLLLKQIPTVLEQALWPWRTTLSSRASFGGGTYRTAGKPYFSWHQLPKDAWLDYRTIVFAAISTHNHFIRDAGNAVYNRSAPILRIRTGCENLLNPILAFTNSSVGAFWLRHNCPPKGGSGIGRGVQDEPWEERYTFDAARVATLAFQRHESALVTELESLARKQAECHPGHADKNSTPTLLDLRRAAGEWHQTREEMISVQEELDWYVYGLYGLLGDNPEDLIGGGIEKPAMKPGQRTFEIILARKMDAGEIETSWFARNDAIRTTKLPEHWSAEYRALIERRLAKVADDQDLQLIERPEYKRRWASSTWKQIETDALRDWLLNRLENPALWFRPAPALRSVAQLADTLRTDADFVSVAGLFARDADLIDVVGELVKDQHVPFLAALRYTEPGMRIRAQWEKSWQLQRREDAGEKVDVPVPPKYKKGDFRDLAYWRNRDKLDLPKERFSSYPGTSRDGTLLLGWAGWDHLQQAQALTAYITERRELDAWDAERLTPLLAGLGELLPWVEQWHPDVDPDFGVRPADAYSGFLDEQLLQLGLTRDDLTVWRPQPPARDRRRTTWRARP